MSSTSSTLSLDYAAPEIRQAQARLLRISLWCGVLPLVCGLSTLWLHWLTGSVVVVIVGLIELLVGGVAVLIGFGVGLTYLIQACRATINRRRSIGYGTLSLAILVLDLPAAVFCAVVGIEVATYPPVPFVVKNTGTLVVDDCTLSIGAQSIHCGRIEPGSSIKVRVLVRSGGTVQPSTKRNGVVSIAPLLDSADADTFGFKDEVSINVNDTAAKLTW